MRKLRKALVIFNPKKPYAKKLAAEVRAFLAANGASATNRASEADALIIVSGDGTLLYNKSRYGLPIFAIGSKHSFICQAHQGNWKKKLLHVLRSGFSTEKRAMLCCEVGGKKLEDALNEVVIRSRDHRVIDIELKVGKKKFSFFADGVLFSTPTGSTAYCYSCGGSELPKSARKYEVAAIAPYRRAFKPVVVPESTVSSARTRSRKADLVFDGQFIHRIKPGSAVTIRKSSRSVELIIA